MTLNLVSQFLSQTMKVKIVNMFPDICSCYALNYLVLGNLIKDCLLGFKVKLN